MDEEQASQETKSGDAVIGNTGSLESFFAGDPNTNMLCILVEATQVGAKTITEA
jgi:hypothetical protein